MTPETVTEFVHVGRHAEILASCRHLAPGDRVSADDLDLSADDHVGQDQYLIDEGRLVPADTFDGPSNAQQLVRDEPAAAARPALAAVPSTANEKES